MIFRRILLAALVLAAALTHAVAEERIERFISDVDVQRNGDLIVTESIQVWAEGRQIKRGILRDFPTTYRRADGSRVEVGFEIQFVTRDGAYEITSPSGWPTAFAFASVVPATPLMPGRIFTSSSTAPRGRSASSRNTTSLLERDRHRLDVPDRHGRGAHPSARERVDMQSAIYTGPQGARGRDATIVEQKPGFIVFRTTKPLPVANGLTVAAGWPKGVVQEPTQMQKIEAVLKDDPALLTAGVGGGLVIGFYLLAWFLVGRDPRKGTIIPLFGPPKGMSAAGVGFVHGMGMDKRTFAAAIVGLGVNGRLKLVDRGQTQVLRHLKSGKPADAAEQAVETALFASRSSVELDNANHETISGAHHQLHDALKGAYGGLFRNNFWLSGLGLVAAVAATAAIVLRTAKATAQRRRAFSSASSFRSFR